MPRNPPLSISSCRPGVCSIGRPIRPCRSAGRSTPTGVASSGARYCYARYTHEFMGLEDGRLFETKIYAKQDAARVLRNDLKRRPEGAIAIGTATDPYQPAEKRFGLTREILGVFAAEGGYELSITTKSDLIVRDVELLGEVARTNMLSVNMTVTTMDRSLASRLEPRAPRPDLRLRAVARLADAGIEVGVFANPVMPLIPTRSKSFGRRRGRQEGRCGIFRRGDAVPYAMRPSSIPFLFSKRISPIWPSATSSATVRNLICGGDYADLIGRRVREVRRSYGLASAPRTYVPEVVPGELQLRLFG